MLLDATSAPAVLDAVVRLKPLEQPIQIQPVEGRLRTNMARHEHALNGRITASRSSPSRAVCG